MTEIMLYLRFLRFVLERAFSKETANPTHYNSRVPSSGHADAVSCVLASQLDATVRVTLVDGKEHFFNRFFYQGSFYDVDLTGDQFGFEKVRCDKEGFILQNSREVASSDISTDTKRRARILARKAGFRSSVIRGIK